MLRIKGFNKDLKCRKMQFEVGKEYKIDSSKLELCTDTVFHYCKTLKQVNTFYDVKENNRYCYIEVLGEEICDPDKCGSNHIKIVREILGEELDILMGRVNGNTGIFNAGDCNTGYSNTGNWNTGNSNAGNSNTGSWNTGNWNTGYSNTGNWNTGNSYAGNSNTGDFNACNYSSGFFCTEEPKVRLFNKEIDISVPEFRESKYYSALFSSPFTLTEEIDGKFVKYTYKEACSKWWEGMSEENKEIVRSIPNFDAEIFEEITGIKDK